MDFFYDCGNAREFVFIVPVKKILFALVAMSTFSFPSPDSYGQNLPAATGTPAASASENGELLNLITLADLTLYKNARDVGAAAQRLLEKTDIIADPKLKTSVRLSLAEITAEPENFPKIRAAHFKKISVRFTEIADEARKNKNYKAALNAAQIAAKADPTNSRARLILSALIDAYGGDTATAIKLMHAGLKFIDLDAPITKDYFAKYFEMLTELQQDYIVADQAQKILKKTGIPAETRKLVALAGAFGLYNRGDYAESLTLIEQEGLAENVQGRILKARNIFASGDTERAISLLEESIAQFPAEKREPLFNQLSRFFSETDRYEGVLDVAKRQLQENADVLGPRLRRLFAYQKLGNTDAFDAEVKLIFEQFSSSQSALVALANFAAEQGLPDLAVQCLRTAQVRSFETGLFVATAVEALVAANRPEEAINAYIQVTDANPNVFDDFKTIISAVLASAYAEAAKQERNIEKSEQLRAHSAVLLNQYLEDKSVRPENQIAVIRHFRRIGRNDLANKVAAAALRAFPWHSQVRAEWISLQLASPESLSQINVPAEIRTLAEMRRPNPTIWKEILAWLDSTANSGNLSAGGWGAPLNAGGISADERTKLRALVAPLAR